MTNEARSHKRGFSLLEVLIVTAVGTIITGAAVPPITNVIANAKMRASMTSVSGLLQNSRVAAIKRNRSVTARSLNRTVRPFGLVYYTKTASDASPLAVNDPQVEMQAPITPYITPSGEAAPAPISTTVLGFIAQTGDPSFNSAGRVCVYSGGTCVSSGFIKYFKDNRVAGSGGWAAISLSPAGRIKRWFWTGSRWSD